MFVQPWQMTTRRVKSIVLITGCCLTLTVIAQPSGDPWERMKRNDLNNDGKVSREEFRGPPQFFDRADANGDGFVTRDEAEAMGGRFGPGGRGFPGPQEGGSLILNRIDSNRDELVSLDEWNQFFVKADENGDGILQPEEWRAATRGQPFRDDAPAVGAPAPRVKVRDLATDREVDLAQPKRITVLIFGSHT